MLNYFDTPVFEIRDQIFDDFDLRVFVKREDLNHEFVSGNKWWKLKYNLQEAKKLGHDTLLTFGGAFSNHLYATSAAAKELGFNSIGIIRGEKVLPLNQTLAFAESCEMKLQFIPREDYRKKNDESFLNRLKNQLGDFYLIPEGGTNLLAVKGCAEFAQGKLLPIDFDYLCLPVGTGGTMAGIIAGLKGVKNVIGFSVLKNGGFLNDEMKKLVRDFSGNEYSNWKLELNYHFGGYAKHPAELDQFILRIKNQNNLPLEFIYTGKMVAGVFDLIARNYFPKGSKILLLHTGGLRD